MNTIRKIFILSLISLGAFAGGIDGGGGTILPQNQLSPEEVRHTIHEDAKAVLRAYLRHLDIDKNYHVTANPISLPGGMNLYSGPVTITDLVESTNIEILMKDACHDANGVEVDGSAVSSKSNSICMSAYRIGPKVSGETVLTQVLALIAHELSHLLGLNEAEATQFQARAIKDLVSVDDQDVKRLGFVPSDLLEYLKINVNEYSNNELALIFKSINNLRKSIRTHGTSISIFTNRENDFYSYIQTKMELLEWYARGKSSQADAAVWAQKYDSVFSNGDNVNFEDLLVAGNKNVYGKIKIFKVKTLSDLQSQLQELSKYFESLSLYGFGFAFNEPLGQLFDPYSTFSNPWKKFEGNYKVLNKVCSNTTPEQIPFKYVRDMDSFKIQPQDGDSNHQVLTYTTSAGIDYVEGLFPGSRDGLISTLNAAIRVSEEGSAALRYFERGNQWEKTNSDILKIEKTGNTYKFERTYSNQFFHDDPIDSITCVFEMEKIN